MATRTHAAGQPGAQQMVEARRQDPKAAQTSLKRGSTAEPAPWKGR